MNTAQVWRFRGAVLLIAALLFGALSVTPAVADEGVEREADPVVAHREALEQSKELPGPSLESVTTTITSGGDIAVRAVRYTVTCTATADSPHGSSGAAKQGKYYIIAKVRVSCRGTGAYPGSITIQVWSSLLWNAAKSKSDPEAIKGAWISQASSKESRVVRVNGKQNTFYVPRNGEIGGTKTGLYQVSTTVTITKPTGQSVGSALSTVRVCEVTKSSAGCTN